MLQPLDMVLSSPRIRPMVKEFCVGVAFSNVVDPWTLLLSISLSDGEARDHPL
jgi:hypothetical protein